ncbi:hypothetical protein [Leucobacter soli]
MPGLAEQAGIAFTESMQVTGIVGGIMMLAVGLLVFFLTPKGTDLGRATH